MHIFIHRIPNVQLIVKTYISDYTLVAILFIIDKNNEVHLVTFHLQTFTSIKLNYDTYDKEFFSQFSLVIQFHLGYSSAKLNALII